MSGGMLGFGLVVLGILFALGMVYALTSRLGQMQDRPHPPRGVHLPAPSLLPAALALGASLLGAGLAFRADDQPIANPWLAVPGLVVMLAGIIGWVRAAGREWGETEHAAHDDGGSGH